MINIRKNTFETNSSSTHSITICTEEEFEKFKNGELMRDWDGTLVSVKDNNNELHTYEDYDYDMYETFEEYYTTPSGDKIVAFGYYGNDY